MDGVVRRHVLPRPTVHHLGRLLYSGRKSHHHKLYRYWPYQRHEIFLCRLCREFRRHQPQLGGSQRYPRRNTSVELPGPSPSLFANPFYTCVNNYYVATTGDDSNPGTQASPWLTLQHADAVGRVAGDCVNVAPGSYAAGVQPTHGGNLASPTGYVVYRCQTLDGCKITASGGNADPAFNISSTGSGPNYLVLDGFEVAAGSMTLYGVGVELYFPNGADTGGTTSHHIWIINDIIHGYGQAGVGTGGGDYNYFLHNLATTTPTSPAPRKDQVSASSSPAPLPDTPPPPPIWLGRPSTT